MLWWMVAESRDHIEGDIQHSNLELNKRNVNTYALTSGLHYVRSLNLKLPEWKKKPRSMKIFHMDNFFIGIIYIFYVIALYFFDNHIFLMIFLSHNVRKLIIY